MCECSHGWVLACVWVWVHRRWRWALLIQHATHMRHICYLLSLRLHHIFVHHLIKGTILRKKVTEHNICFEILYNFYLKHFSFEEEDCRKCRNVFRWSTRYYYHRIFIKLVKKLCDITGVRRLRVIKKQAGSEQWYGLDKLKTLCNRIPLIHRTPETLASQFWRVLTMMYCMLRSAPCTANAAVGKFDRVESAGDMTEKHLFSGFRQEGSKLSR